MVTTARDRSHGEAPYVASAEAPPPPHPRPPFVFREQALNRYFKAANDAEAQLLKASPPWTWWLFGLLAAAIAAAFAISTVANVEVTGRGNGVLRPAGGVRMIEPQVGGTIVEVLADSGQMVEAGQPLLRLDSASVQAALLEADRRLALVRSRLTAMMDRRQDLYEQHEDLLRQRVDILGRRATSEDDTIARLRSKAISYQALEGKGYVGSVTRDQVVDDVARAERERLAYAAEISETKAQMASLESELESDRWKWEQEVEDAEAKRNALAYSVDQLTIKAPQAGYLESVLARPGDVVQAGAALGRLVAGGAPSHAVAFLPERDRAFVGEGALVRLEVEQLPYAEFGTLGARVERISAVLAGRDEIREALGDEAAVAGPVYRVELSVADDARTHAVAAQLRSGMLVTARFTLRRRRLVALILDPLRRWFR